jgi:hypothetical protein
MGSDTFANPYYTCFLRVLSVAEEIASDTAWYDDIWGNYIKVYLFELLKIFFGYSEAMLMKYSNKYLTQLLTGHNF